MRVLFVVTDADIGGAERLLATLARSWDEGDVLRLVVVMGPGTLSTELEDAFESVHYLGYSGSSRNIMGMVRSLEREIVDFGPDVITSHLFHADLLTALARSSAVKTTTMHTQRLTKADHPLTRAIARAVGVLSFRFDGVIPSGDSASMQDFIRQLGMRKVLPPILNGADVPDAASFDPSSRTFLSLARNHPVKGHDVLFAAFARIADQAPQWSLRAYGPGVDDDDERMRSLVADAGAEQLLAEGRIQLAGPTARPAEVLQHGAALVISSKYGETSPLVGAEASGAGVPVISTDVGSCAHFVDDDRLLVKPDDVDDLARALECYTRLSDDERQSLSILARTRAEARYDPAAVARRYREAFVGLLADAGKP